MTDHQNVKPSCKWRPAACRHTGHQLQLLQCNESICRLSHSPCDFWILGAFPSPSHVLPKTRFFMQKASEGHNSSCQWKPIQNSRFWTCFRVKHPQSKPVTLASILGFVGPPWTLHPRRHADMRCFFASIDSNCTRLGRTFGPQKAYVQILFFLHVFCVFLYVNNMETKYCKHIQQNIKIW